MADISKLEPRLSKLPGRRLRHGGRKPWNGITTTTTTNNNNNNTNNS